MWGVLDHDLSPAGRARRIDLLVALAATRDPLPVMVVTGEGSFETAAEPMRRCARRLCREAAHRR